MTIRILAPDAAARLAAGEVVERPASVVRELVDNALDAGARSVTVRISAGGLELVRVSDDGGGIPPADLRLAVRRHATSKLRSIEELPSIGSLGFRGEALYAVAAVSRLRICSRTAEAAVGREAVFEAGAALQEKPWAGPPGTLVEVRDLFFNTPARLRFLKSAAAEANRIDRLLRRYALGTPDIVFRLHDEVRDRAWNGEGGGLYSAVCGVYGRAIAEQMLPTDLADGPVEVSGLVSAPSVTRSTRSDMHVFVNGRWVVSRPLYYAVEEAYSTFLMSGRFPVLVLQLRIPGEHVDVNVHPAKSEVRLADERGVARAVARAVRSALLGAREARGGAEERTPHEPRAHERAAGAGDAFLPVPYFGFNIEREAGGRLRTERPTAERRLPPLRVLGQLARAFIVAEGPDGLCMIDQHAAHERVILERLQDQVVAQAVEAQRLLEPEVVPLTPVEAARTAELVDQLHQLGFEAEPFGPDALLLRSVPAPLPAARAAAAVAALGEGMEGLSTVEDRLRAMLCSLACHSAVRAGDSLDATEMRRLVEDLERARVPTACAHGRPTILEFSTTQLEREFGRRGPGRTTPLPEQ